MVWQVKAVIGGKGVVGKCIYGSAVCEGVMFRYDDESQILTGILENIPVIVFQIDSQGAFTGARGCGLRRLGIENPDDIVGVKVLDRYPDVEDELNRALRGETVICESSGIANSETWWLQNYIFKDPSKESGCIGFAYDITDLKNSEEEKNRLEQQVLHSQRLESLGILAGGAAHDFNNLLMGVLGNASLVLEGEVLSEKSRNSLLQIIHASERAADICQSMLDFSRKSKTYYKKIYLDEAVRSVSNLLEVLVKSKGEFYYHFEENNLPINGQTSQIKQLLLNFAANSCEAFNGKYGRIDIRVGKKNFEKEFLSRAFEASLLPGKYPYIEFEDNGSGMSGETVAKVFDPFFTTKFTGRGLGLSSVFGIVKNHGACIVCDSSLNRGTTFTVVFPNSEELESEVEESQVPFRKSENIGQLKGEILLVDDDETSREVIKKMLESAGANVSVVDNGYDCLELIRSNKGQFNVVVLDLTMPNMQGDEVFYEIRKSDPSIPIVISSAYGEDDMSSKFLGAYKPNGYIQKPYGCDDLRYKLQGFFH